MGDAPVSVAAVRAAMASSRDALCVVDGRLDGVHAVVHVNAAFTTITGWTAREFLGRSPLDLASPDVDRAELRRMRTTLTAGRSGHGTLEVLRADGSTAWVEIDVTIARAGAAPGGTYVLLGRDVTAAHIATTALERANALLRMAATTGGVGIWSMEPTTGWAEWDETYRRLVGIGADEPASVQRGLLALHPDDVAVAREHFGGDYLGHEHSYRVVHPDGSVRHALVRGVVVEEGSDGRPRRYSGTIVDITASHEPAERVTDILESITDAYVAVDGRWRITYLNRRAERDFGVRRQDVLGRHLWQEVFPTTNPTVFQRRGLEVMASGQPAVFDGLFLPTRRWVEVHCFPLTDGIAGYLRDTSDRRTAERERSLRVEIERSARVAAETAQVELARQATHDALTGLVNRPELTRRLDGSLATTRGAGEQLAVLFLDLDRFKLVNDTLGHAAGDELLVVVAHRLAAVLRPQDVVARIGGDEFVVALLGAPQELVPVVVSRLLDEVRRPVVVQGQELTVTASLGVCVGTAGATADTMLRDADVALYRAKDAGRDQSAWFDAETRESVVRRVGIETGLRRAVAGGQLRLVHQPSFDLRSGRATGVEALLRWEHPEHGLLLPGRFVPVAEDSGLIVGVGEWVIATACQEAAGWPAERRDVVAWVNVSLRQLRRPGLAATVVHHLAETGLSPERFGVEVTESALGDDSTALPELLELTRLGVHLAIDDFGTGYSSLARLRGLPVDVLKIDRSFVAELGGTSDPIVDAVVALGHALRLTTIAEGVELPEQLDALRAAGCDEVAGFLLARPVPVAQLWAAAATGSALLAGG